MACMKVHFGQRVHLPQPELVNLYECHIGDDSMISAFVEIGRGVIVGKRCRIQAYTFIPQGVEIGDDVFIGPRVTFTNDKEPPSRGSWQAAGTIVEAEVSIGAGAIILPGVTLGKGCMIGAGAVVTKDVPPGAVWVGNPAQHLRKRNSPTVEIEPRNRRIEVTE